jgi:hypothetical protein
MERPGWTSFVYLAFSAIVSYWLIQAERGDGESTGITMAHNVRKVARWVDQTTTTYIDNELDKRRTV